MSKDVFMVLLLIFCALVFISLLWGPTLFIALRQKNSLYSRSRVIAISLSSEFLAFISLVALANWLSVLNAVASVLVMAIVVGISGALILKNVSPLDTNVTHWLAVPVGVLLSMLGLLVIVPILVDFIIQTVAAIPEGNRQTPMLTLDLVLSTLYLTGSLFFTGWWARDPKARASISVASFVFVLTVFMRKTQGLYEPNVMPQWYEISILAGIFLSYGVTLLLLKRLGLKSLTHPSSGTR